MLHTLQHLYIGVESCKYNLTHFSVPDANCIDIPGGKVFSRKHLDQIALKSYRVGQEKMDLQSN